MDTKHERAPNPTPRGPGRLDWLRVALQAIQTIAVIMIHTWHNL
jgi:hypothetical protein